MVFDLKTAAVVGVWNELGRSVFSVLCTVTTALPGPHPGEEWVCGEGCGGVWLWLSREVGVAVPESDIAEYSDDRGRCYRRDIEIAELDILSDVPRHVARGR